MNNIDNEDDNHFRLNERFFPMHVNRHFADFDAALRRSPFDFDDLSQDHALFRDLGDDDNGQVKNNDILKSSMHDSDKDEEKENVAKSGDGFYSRSFSSSSVFRQGTDGTVRRVLRKSYRDSDGQDKEFRMFSTGDKRYVMRRNGEEKEEEFEGDGVKSLDDFRNVWHTKQLADTSDNSRMVEDTLLRDEEEE